MKQALRNFQHFYRKQSLKFLMQKRGVYTPSYFYNLLTINY